MTTAVEKIKAVYNGTNPVQHGNVKLRPHHGLVILKAEDYTAMKKVLGDKLKNFDEAQAEFDQTGEDLSAETAATKEAPIDETSEDDADEAETAPKKAGRPRRTD